MITPITEAEQALITTLQRTTEALNQATAERDALKADAERWRYMRQKGANWFGIADAANKLDGGFDETVDMAMKGTSC